MHKQDRLADAEAMYKEALRIRELKLGHESLGVAKTLNNLAGLHEKQDRLADAEACFPRLWNVTVPQATCRDSSSSTLSKKFFVPLSCMVK